MPPKTAEKSIVNINRLPENIRRIFSDPIPSHDDPKGYLIENEIYLGDSLDLLNFVRSNSVSLSVWSPPYFVGKSYESDLSFDAWRELLRLVIELHFRILKPGGFLAVNIADILCFRDEKMPKIQADAIHRKKVPITRNDIFETLKKHPGLNRYKLAKLLGCSEQTIDRRLNGNNIRGGKHEAQTRVKVVGGMIEDWALSAGLYPYDRRIWVKDAAWENSKWASLSYRAVDEFEYIYIFWKPGITQFNRRRLSGSEWREWGSRGVWKFPSVRANNDHEAKFPKELPYRAIRLLTDPGDLVLDCFLGSGTTAVAAIETGRSYIGIEKERNYYRLARKNIREVQLGLC